MPTPLDIGPCAGARHNRGALASPPQPATEMSTVKAAVMAAKASNTFDYSVLPEAISTDLRAGADRIRSLVKPSVGDIIAIGQELQIAKGKLEHGRFGEWIVAEFCMSARSAENYMRAAALAADKNEIVSDLPLTTLYLLAAPSTPNQVRDKIIARFQGGEVIPVEAVKRMVCEAKEAAREAQEEEKEKRHQASLHPSSRRRRQRRLERAEEQRRQREEAREQAESAANEMVQLLEERLGADLPRFLELHLIMQTGHVWLDTVVTRLRSGKP